MRIRMLQEPLNQREINNQGFSLWDRQPKIIKNSVVLTKIAMLLDHAIGRIVETEGIFIKCCNKLNSLECEDDFCELERKKIAIIRPGIHTINEQFCHYLSNEGYSITLIAPEGSTKINPSNYDVKYIKSFNLGRFVDFPLTPSLYNYLKHENFDIIQSNEDFQFMTWLAAFYSWKHNKQFILIEEIYKLPRFKIHRLFFILFQKTICKFAWNVSDKIICHSKASFDFLKQSMGSKYNPNKIYYLPIGVNTEIFHKTKSKKQSVLNIISVGRLISHKDYPILLKACEYLDKHKKIDFHLTIIGRGELKNELKRQIGVMDLAQRVKIIDNVPFNDLKFWYSDSDIFVLSSVREAMGAVILEAMACGLPVIISDVGGAPDFVENGKNGFVFKNGNHLDLANKICNLADNDLRNSFSNESLKLVKEKFDWNVVIKEYAKLFAIDGDSDVLLKHKKIKTGLN